MDALQKAIAADPQLPFPHKLYAFALSSTSKFAESVPVWQDYIKLAPDNADGPASLGASLLELNRYDEAAQALESAVKLNPNRSSYQWQLATASLRAGKDEKALPVYRKLSELNSPPETLNQAAYELAEANKGLPVALDFAQKSVRAWEEDSTKIDLAHPRPVDEWQTVTLASYWGTLGWVQLRLGKLDDAEKFLTASWKLTQNGIAAAHLCQLYLDQHKPQAALHMCQMARSRLPMERDPALYRLPDLIEQNNARMEKLSPGSSKVYAAKVIDEIVDMRDFKLPRVFPGVATAIFEVLLQFDSETRTFKVHDVKFTDGSDKLKPFGKSLTKLNFNFVSPDGNPASILRRGNFLCGTACEFVLPDATTGPVRSIPIHPTN
jgi:tetratricopeptide (TPR) repeat protein